MALRRHCAGLRLLHGGMSDFAKDYKDRSSKLGDLYANKNWVDYSVIVHALKSNARTIGAINLADAAASLEALSKAGDENQIIKEHEPAMVLYRDTSEKILRILGENIEADAHDDDGDEILEFAPDSDEVMEFMPDSERNE